LWKLQTRGKKKKAGGGGRRGLLAQSEKKNAMKAVAKGGDFGEAQTTKGKEKGSKREISGGPGSLTKRERGKKHAGVRAGYPSPSVREKG